MIQGKTPAGTRQITDGDVDRDSGPIGDSGPLGDSVVPWDYRPSSVAGRMMRWLLHRLGDPAIQIVLWNDEVICTSTQPPVASVRISDRKTLWKLMANPSSAFGEAYTAGRITVRGDLSQLAEQFYRGESESSAVKPLSGPFSRYWKRASRQALAQSRDNIHHHYDIGNEFYSRWLGKTMAYTCAYFPSDGITLDQAQIAKMHHVSRKLRLRPGDRVVEAGCGWGSLALHMARYYGATVAAFNISHEQIAYARRRAKEEGLADRVEFIEEDYRNIRCVPSRYDAFVSVGMLEHVSPADYAEFGHIISGCLSRSGRGLIHSIGRNRRATLDPWITKHIFPGAHPPSLKEMMDIFEPTDLSVIDVENLRPHYARTLQYWRQLFEQHAESIEQMYDKDFVRTWRLYLAGSEAAFNTGEMQLFQVVFAPHASASIPWTRADLYDEAAGHGRL